MSVAIGSKIHMNLHIVYFVSANLCTFSINIYLNYGSLVILTVAIL